MRIKIKHDTIHILVPMLLVGLLNGCSTLEGLGDKLSGSTPAAGSDRTSMEGVFYVGSKELPMYQVPGGKLIGQLPPYTKLYRDDLERGYAHVRVEATGQTGWVNNARLLWRLPATPSQPEPAKSVTVPEGAPGNAVQESNEPVNAAPSDIAPQPEVAPATTTAAPQPGADTESTVTPNAPVEVTPSEPAAKPSVKPSIFNPY